MPFELTIHEGGGPARKQLLPKDVVFLGRREDNDVVLPYTFVSSRHGRLFRRGAAVFVEDMGSTNGTLINGEPLTPMVARALQPEDRVEIGEIAVQARWAEETPADDAEVLTYHEMARPAALVVPRPAAPRPPLPTPAPPLAEVIPLPASVEPGGVEPVPRAEAPTTHWELEKTAHLGQTSLSDALATSRTPSPGEETERDPYLAWEIFFKTVGILAILGGLLLLVFVLVA